MQHALTLLYRVCRVLSSGERRVDADTAARAIHGIMDSLDAVLEGTARGKTLDEMMDALRLTLVSWNAVWVRKVNPDQADGARPRLFWQRRRNK